MIPSLWRGKKSLNDSNYDEYADMSACREPSVPLFCDKHVFFLGFIRFSDCVEVFSGQVLGSLVNTSFKFQTFTSSDLTSAKEVAENSDVAAAEFPDTDNQENPLTSVHFADRIS